MTLDQTTRHGKATGAVFATSLIAALFTADHAAASTENILLTIDVSDHAAVTITTTGLHSEIDGSIKGFKGFTLLDFLTDAPVVDNSEIAFDPDLGETTGLGIGTGNQRFLNIAAIVFETHMVTGEDLNFYNMLDAPASNPEENITYDFSTGSAAFDGTVTVDFTQWTSFMPAIGSSGRIAAGDEFSGGEEFGTWSVIGTPPAVPLPAGLPLILTGAGAFALLRRRKT